MMWVDYAIDSIPGGKGFKVKGDWEGEVMGVAKDGSLKAENLNIFKILLSSGKYVDPINGQVL